MNLSTFIKKSVKGELESKTQVEFLVLKMEITSQELAGVVLLLQEQITATPNLRGAIDVCGTGGSGLARINTSTISAFILARLGVPVAKHGNKASSGRVGSFDLLEAMGIKFSNNIVEIENQYKKENLAFLFAPFFHPVMKKFTEMRRQIGVPTFFNLLGPLLNPSFPKRQIIGTAFKDKMRLIAETCRLLGKEKVYVVCGEDGLDEVTITGKTFVTELSNGKIKSYTITPEDFGVNRAEFSEIKGGDLKFNNSVALNILRGTCLTRHLDLVLVNCALALKLVDKVKSLREGYEMASIAINTPNILLNIVRNKRKEVSARKNKYLIGKLMPSTRDFADAIKQKGLALIAEIKRASPSAEIILKTRFSPSIIARKYEKEGANAISVLCDKKFFKGGLKYLAMVVKSTFKTPILCKDFIIDEYQIFEARKFGADAILLIASILTEAQINKFIEIANTLKMVCICEVHTLGELKKILKTSAEIIGINNRDLRTFKVDVSTTIKLAAHIPQGKIVVSESGFRTRSDVDKLPENINAVLVGTALINGANFSEFINI